jgi:hypothetical protein
VRTVEHVFRPRPPVWIWAALLGHLALAASVGYFLGWRLAPLAATGTPLLVFLLWVRSVRLECDEQGLVHLATGRKNPISVDLSRLVDVSFLGAGYSLRDEEGNHVVGPLDDRLRFEVREAAGRRRLELSPETEGALLSGRSRGHASKLISVVLSANVLAQFCVVGGTVLGNGGFELDRDNRVDATELRAANAVPAAVVNPFVDGEPRELYLVGLDSRSQGQLPRLAEGLGRRFGTVGLLPPPLRLGADELDPVRHQLDGWKITSRLLIAYQTVHPGRPALVIAVTRLDTFFSDAPQDRFAFMTSGATDGNVVCGGLISTARFDFWPGSEEERLAKMAGRLLGRCLGIDEHVSIRSLDDVDRLDGYAGADAQTIARRVAERRALPGAPRR